MKKQCFAVIAVWVILHALPAIQTKSDLPVGSFPETADVRGKYAELITGPVKSIKSMKSISVTGSAGRVRISAAAGKTGQTLTFALGTDKGGNLPAQGTYRYVRNGSTGSLMEFDVALRSEVDTDAILVPFGDRAKMDIRILGKTIYSGIPVSQPIDALALVPFSRIVELTGGAVDWSLFSPDPIDYGESKAMIAAIRKRLPELLDADDGAMDSTGRFVYIETGKLQPDGKGGFNCSGFAKWIVDGLYAPLTGTLLDIADLKLKHPETRKNDAGIDESLDPFFGLDWTRNLAQKLNSVLSPGYPTTITSSDVRDVPSFLYTENVGYPVPELPPLLYIKAVTSPGRFYLVSINGDNGTLPRLRRHFHVVAAFPYFDAAGTFRTAVFEREVESSLASLSRRYPTMSAHLVEVKASDRFDPPATRAVAVQPAGTNGNNP
jgi:hypothetical protein